MKAIETSRLHLREIRPSDQASFEILLGDKDVMAFSSGLKTRSQVRQWVKEKMDAYKNNGFGQLAVTLKETEEIIGYCGLTKYDDINGHEEIELGYRLLKTYWGAGYATEAAQAVKTEAFKNFPIKRLISIVSPQNRRSVRVVTKLGMHEVGTVMLPGYSYPDSIYATEEWSSD